MKWSATVLLVLYLVSSTRVWDALPTDHEATASHMCGAHIPAGDCGCQGACGGECECCSRIAKDDSTCDNAATGQPPGFSMYPAGCACGPEALLVTLPGQVPWMTAELLTFSTPWTGLNLVHASASPRSAPEPPEPVPIA